jgi:predicted dehydrogenase
MESIRIGVIGLGGMGESHANNIYAGKVDGAKLTAVCDTSPPWEEKAKSQFGPQVKFYSRPQGLLASNQVDGVVIATPHPSHPVLAGDALRRGLHVMCEKPAGVDVRSVRELTRVIERSQGVFAMMFQYRLNPVMRKLKDIVASGELGPLQRICWIITDWYRTERYYQSGSWRAKWETEGGALLINQCSHTLDTWQWVFGLPKRLRAFCRFGKYHQIETEDEVTAYMEYENGVSAVLISSTGEAPGTNRLEVTGDRGKLVLEDGRITVWRTRMSVAEHRRTSLLPSEKPESWTCDVPIRGDKEGHIGVMKDWVKAIRTAAAPLASGMDGLNGLELSNAMLLSTWTDAWVSLPVDGEAFCEQLAKSIGK